MLVLDGEIIDLGGYILITKKLQLTYGIINNFLDKIATII